MEAKMTKIGVILLVQLFMFYIFPMFAGPTDAIGIVILILLSTLLLSMILGGISNKKTKYFSKKQYKDVTGCVITPRQELKVPNKRRKDLLDVIKNKSIEDMTIKEIRSVYGKLNSMRQIEPNIFPQIYNRVKKQYYKLGAQYSNKSIKSKVVKND